MKIIVIALALITPPFSGFIGTPLFQTPATSTKPTVRVDASYDKKKDTTKLMLEPLLLWTNPNPDQYEQVLLFVRFECPGKKIVRPKEVLFRFTAESENLVSFPSLEFSVSIDGALLELGKLKGRQRNRITLRAYV